MNSPRFVTFLSDFGWSGGYVAACEATITRLCLSARVLHVSHDVRAGDVSAGALVLARVLPLYPAAIHLAVVDPGVGTARRPLALLTARGDYLVGPDNGLLMDAAESLGGVSGAWTLEVEWVQSMAGLPVGIISSTFHGRDLFAPASALLAAQTGPDSLGRPVEAASLVRLVRAQAQVSHGVISAPVLEIDHFGNVGLGLPFAELPHGRYAGAPFLVGKAGGDSPARSARVVTAYHDLLPDELGLIRDSWGQTALVLSGASASELLGIHQGATVTLAPTFGAKGLATELDSCPDAHTRARPHDEPWGEHSGASGGPDEIRRPAQ